MKFNKVRFSGSRNVDFPMLGYETFGPYVIKSMDGVGPPEIVVKIAETVQEGGVYQGKRPANRQLVSRVRLQPDWNSGQTPEELRTELYDLLSPQFGQPTILKFMLDDVVVSQADGQISKFEISVFTKDPEVQITLDCFHPYLMGPELIYQFPFKQVLPPVTPLDSYQTAINVVNTGTAPAGFWMGITFQSVQTGPLILSDNSYIGQSLTLTGNWAVGDTFVIDTRAGTRGVWKILSGRTERISLLNNLVLGSTWLQLHGGNNQLRINNFSFDWYQNGFGHTPAYWGI